MKLRLVTKTDKRNPVTLKKLTMSVNCDIFVILPIYGQFRPIWKPDSGRMTHTYIFINSDLLPYRN